MLLLIGCEGESIHRGRVIDQDTGAGVAGAIVVARYMGGGSWSGAGCNRVESVVSDQDGWFAFPTNRRAGIIVTEAYKRGFWDGQPNRAAVQDTEEREKWRLAIVTWNASNTKPTLVGTEPGIYYSREHAERESGININVYVRQFEPNREERLKQLRTFQGDCAGGPRVSLGLVPALESILEEEMELGQDEAATAITRRWLERAKERSEARR